MEAKECDPGLEEAVKSIIYAAPRTEIKELQQARQLLVEKYGKDFALEAMENTDGKVAERVVKKLRVTPPEPTLVEAYLREIAKTYGVPWPKEEVVPDGQDDDDDEPSTGEAVKNLEEPLTTQELSKAKPPSDLGPKSPVHIAPASPSTENPAPKVKLPGPPELKPGSKLSVANNKSAEGGAKTSGSNGKSGGVGGKIPDVDELSKRFAALKR